MNTALAEAIKDDPTGEFCGHCGKVNTWCDDLGWFCAANAEGNYVPGCEACVGHPGGDR